MSQSLYFSPTDVYAVQQIPVAVVVGRQVRHIGEIDLKQVIDTFRVGPSSRAWCMHPARRDI